MTGDEEKSGEGEMTKGTSKIWGEDDECVHYLDCGGGFTDKYICQDSLDIYFKCVLHMSTVPQ